MADETTLEIEITGPELASLDAWIARQNEPRPSRSEAVKRILAQTLGSPEEHTIPVDELNSSNDE